MEGRGFGGGGSPAVKGGGARDEESFSCFEGSRDRQNSKHSHSDQHSMKRQGRRETEY